MKYKTLTAKTAEDMDVKVQELTDQGYEPLGAPYVLNNCIHQSMVLELKEI